MRYSRFLFSFLMVLPALIILTGCPGKKEGFDRAKARQAITDANTKFTAAVQQGEAAGIAGLYTDDATLLPPDSNMVKGNGAIEAFWKGGLTAGIKNIILTTDDVSGAGDLAYEIGTFVTKIQLDGQAPVEQKGKYLVVWQKTSAGEWKLHVDIWNYNPIP